MVRTSEDQDITIENCYGSDISQAASSKNIVITARRGTRRRYLDGCRIVVKGNAQDAVGDTMNDGAIIIHARRATPPVTACAAARSSFWEHRLPTGIHMKRIRINSDSRDRRNRRKLSGRISGRGLIIVLGSMKRRSAGRQLLRDRMHAGKFLRAEELRRTCRSRWSFRSYRQGPGEIRPHVEDFAGESARTRPKS